MKNIDLAVKVTGWISLPMEMLYEFACALLLTLPILLLLEVGCALKKLFSVPDPVPQEIIEAEDDVLNSGGGFASLSGFS